MAVHSLADGSYYVVDAQADRVFRVAPDGSRSELGRGLQTPVAIAVDGPGNVYVSELDSHRIRRIDAGTGRVSTFVGP